MKKYIVCGILGIAALLALLSGIVFNVVSTTGYLTGSPYNGTKTGIHFFYKRFILPI